MNDNLKVDFLYVLKGMLKITLVRRDHNQLQTKDELKPTEKVIYIRENEHFDFIDQHYSCKDYVIDKITAEDPATLPMMNRLLDSFSKQLKRDLVTIEYRLQ